jgi:hypothetical protein
MMKEIYSQALCSLLTLEIKESLDLLLVSELPPIIYRDFDQQSHRDNFVSGNIWFSGPNQNRFFLGDDNRRDEYEYRNRFGYHVYEYCLSFTTILPVNGKPAIAIHDVRGFITALKNDLEQTANQKPHSVTWLMLGELRRRISVGAIKKYPTQQSELVLLQACGIGCGCVTYEDKILSIQNGYNSIEIVNNARNKNARDNSQDEYRIWLNTGDFLPPYSGNALHNLVKYLKLSAPSISQYCELIN